MTLLGFKPIQLLGLILLCLMSDVHPMGILPISVYRCVDMEGKIQTQIYGFPEDFAPKNIGILHISYPKMWVKIVLVVNLMARDYF